MTRGITRTPLFATLKQKGRAALLVAGVCIVNSMAAGVRGEDENPSFSANQYNVVWDSQSGNAGGSMPVSGGDIGLNIWVENNELLFYIGRVGCRDENGALLKPGRVRVNISPNPFVGGFRQELKLQEGHAEITGLGAGGGVIKVWVEVARPVIHVEANMKQPVSITSTYENWRREDRILANVSNKHGARGMCMITFDAYPGEVVVRKDTVETDADSVLFYHRIPDNSFLFDYSVTQQGLGSVESQLWNPLKHLTWGGMMRGEGFSLDGTTSGTYGTTAFEGWRLSSDTPAQNHHLEILMHTDQVATVNDWKSGLQRLADSTVTISDAWNANQAWWSQFWKRSHIVVNPSADDRDLAWRVGRNYNLFRYMLAANVNGWEPSVFNGNVFTFDPVYVNGRGYTPDYRQWGASFHAQNQRLMYWPMLKSGDFDMMLPLFNQYRNGLTNARARVRQYWGHDGACFVEAPGSLMLPGPAMYGFPEGGGRGRPAGLEAGVQVNTAVGYNYQSQLEYAWMMLQYHRFSGLDITRYLPMIKQSVIFYDEHYQYRRNALKGAPLTDDGKLEIAPSNALEGFHGCTNPAEAVAGLKRVVEELGALPESMNTAAERRRWQEIAARLPDLPVATDNGRPYMKPAADRPHGHNLSPEMYPLFPYDLFSLGQPDLNIMQNSWNRIPQDLWLGWTQQAIHAARLGDTGQAKALILQKLSDGNRRFPAFFPVGYDWQPDHDSGGSGMIALQEMLMQTIGDEIRLLPAWPKDWDVDFKLHAPRETIVEGRYRNGKLEHLKVTPTDRRKDVVVGVTDK